jgi:hypothetical protein
VKSYVFLEGFLGAYSSFHGSLFFKIFTITLHKKILKKELKQTAQSGLVTIFAENGLDFK